MQPEMQIQLIETKKWLVEVKRDLSSISEKSNIQAISQKIAQKVIKHHFGCILALDHNDHLARLFDCYSKQKRDEAVAKQLEIIYAFGNNSFFRRMAKYKNGISALQNQGDAKKSFEKFICGSQAPRYQQMCEYLDELYGIKDKQNEGLARDLIPQFLDFVRRAKDFESRTAFEEIFITWVKRQVEQIQIALYKELGIKNTGLCCRLHFMQQESIHVFDLAQEIPINSKEKMKIVKAYEYYIKEFQKLAISFLNTNGGVIYIGAESDGKKFGIGGISLEAQERVQLLKAFASDMFGKIYPQSSLETEGQAEDQKMNRESVGSVFKNQQNKKMIRQSVGSALKNQQNQAKRSTKNNLKEPPEAVNYHYTINKYISAQFINIYDKDDLTLARVANQKAYVIRVKIQPGDPFQIYHCINQNDTPEAYFRQGKKEKQLTFKQFYEQFYRKAKAKAGGKSIPKHNIKTHQFCRLFALQ